MEKKTAFELISEGYGKETEEEKVELTQDEQDLLNADEKQLSTRLQLRLAYLKATLKEVEDNDGGEQD